MSSLPRPLQQQGIPDVVIGSCRVIAIGDAWQHEGRIRALQQLLMQRGLNQLALVDGREPWYERLWAQLLGPADASVPACDRTRDCGGSKSCAGTRAAALDRRTNSRY